MQQFAGAKRPRRETSMRRVAEHLLGMAGFQVSRTIDSYADLARVLKGHEITAIVDGGAAKGTETARLAELFPNASVYAFEPHPRAFSRLQTQFKEGGRIRLFPVAISDSVGNTTLHLSAKPTQTSLLKPIDPKMMNVGSVDVEVTTLARMIESKAVEKPQLLKLDLQGAELGALRGMDGYMADVLAVLVEVSFRNRYAGGCLYHEVAAELHRSNLRLYRFSDVHAHATGAWVRADAIFLRGEMLDHLLEGANELT